MGHPGAQEHRVSRPQLDPLCDKGVLEVGRGNTVARGQRLDAAMSGDIDQDATGHQRAQVLDPAMLEAAALGAGYVEAVVEPPLVEDVAEGVDVGGRPMDVQPDPVERRALTL